MTQNTQPGSFTQARGFQRRAFAPRTPRPKFRPVDTLWMTSLAILSLAATVLRFGVDAIGDIGAFAAAATVAGLYFIGWRVRDRSTGVIAGTLLALSLTYSGGLIGHPVTAVFTLLSIAAFTAMAGGQLIAAALLAGVASVLRPDGLLLGVALLCMPPPDDDSRLRWRPIGLFLLTTALGALLAYSLHYTPPALRIGVTSHLIGQAILGGNAVLAWFLWPFLADLGEPARLRRWLPLLAWTILYAAAESLFYFVKGGQSWPPLAPIFALLVAGGMARLIPVLAGEFANPTLRYVLATLAVVSLVGVRAALDWPRAHLSPAARAVVNAPITVTRHENAHVTHSAVPTQTPHAVVSPAAPVAAHTIVPAPASAAIHPVAPAPMSAAIPPAAPTPQPAVAPAPKPIAVATPTVKPGAVPLHVVVVPREAVAAKPGAPHIPDSEGDNNSVRTYIMHNGRLIKRSPWAINWERKQQALAKQREAAAHAAAPAPSRPSHPAPGPAIAVKAQPPAPAKPAAKPIPSQPTIAAKPIAKPVAPAKPASVAKPIVRRPAAPHAAIVRRAAPRTWWKPRPRRRSIWAIRWEQAHRRAR